MSGADEDRPSAGADSAGGGSAGAGSVGASSAGSEPADAAGSRRTASRPRWRRIVDHPLTHFFAALLLIALVQGVAVKLFMVPSGSMEHTLEVGDRILVNRLASAPEPGDVVVFTADDELWRSSSAPASGPIALAKQGVKWLFGDVLGFGPTTGHTLVKRVIAVEGQTVSCCDVDGRLLVDGEPLDEPYIFEDPIFEPGSLDCTSAPVSQRCFGELTVPSGMLLVLGDHRGASSDGISQCRGRTDGGEACVRWAREEDVIGEAFAVVWPLNRFGGLSG